MMQALKNEILQIKEKEAEKQHSNHALERSHESQWTQIEDLNAQIVALSASKQMLQRKLALQEKEEDLSSEQLKEAVEQKRKLMLDLERLQHENERLESHRYQV